MTILPPVGSRRLYVGLLIILAGIITVLLRPILPVGGPFGYWDAKRDVSQGHLAMIVSMSETGWRQEWRKTVKDNYNIEIGGRIPGSFNGSGFSGSYDRAYNSVQRAEIIRRFGSDVVREEMMEAFKRRAEYVNSGK